jgi:hypothetical protein
MLSVEQNRELFADMNLSEEELEDIRVLSWLLAGVAFDVWQKRREKNDKTTGNSDESGN